jgi:hypothetical protein
MPEETTDNDSVEADPLEEIREGIVYLLENIVLKDKYRDCLRRFADNTNPGEWYSLKDYMPDELMARLQEKGKAYFQKYDEIFPDWANHNHHMTFGIFWIRHPFNEKFTHMYIESSAEIKTSWTTNLSL